MKRWSHGSALALALAVSCWCGAARAQDGAGHAERERALELFQRSAVLYQEGRFAEAASLLREARELHPEPVLSYNLARALEGAGDLAGALEAYRTYLEEAPEAPDAPATRARLEALERHLAEIRAIEEERARLRSEQDRARSAPRRATPRGPDAAPWVVAGIGGGVLLIGAIVGGIAVARNADAQRATSHAQTVSIAAEAGALATGANVMFVAGGAAVLLGGIWGAIDLATLPSGSMSARLEIGAASLGVSGTF